VANQVFPTKGNLIQTQKSLALAELGYDLMDRKRNVLVREMMTLIDKAKTIQGDIDDTYSRAYECLRKANITLGICEGLSEDVPIEKSVTLETRSVMGVSLPTLSVDDKDSVIPYGFDSSNIMLDEAYLAFSKVKKLTVELAEVENSVYRLAVAIKKTLKRANALKNIMIPDFTENIKYISSYLEEKEREERSRLKVIKSTKDK
jgi:V/A-type H+-transporting ATPase subunit D